VEKLSEDYKRRKELADLNLKPEQIERLLAMPEAAIKGFFAILEDIGKEKTAID
jgi:hypothetical protein